MCVNFFMFLVEGFQSNLKINNTIKGAVLLFTEWLLLAGMDRQVTLTGWLHLLNTCISMTSQMQ